MDAKDRRVKVLVRIRPTQKFAYDVIDIQPDGRTINFHGKRDESRGIVNNQLLDWSFKFDSVLNNVSQEDVYNTVGNKIVTDSLSGFNGTIMCYGQTGAGKTFTMTGATENFINRGIIPRAVSHLFREIENRPEQMMNISISYVEIYNETMIDLLSSLPNTLGAQSSLYVVEDENGTHVKGLSRHMVQTEEEALNLLFEGEMNRAIAEHSLNKHSSRSHCIFTIHIESRSRVLSDARYVTSKLNFVDLAGSERIGKTGSAGKTQQEALYINKSLSFLEQTIIALADKRREHVPYRQSKLTHYLKDSIGGRCHTLLIANIWGETVQLEETISTLRFATRMMCISVEPAVNEHVDPVLKVKQLEKEINALKRELAMHNTLANRPQTAYDQLSEQQRHDLKEHVNRYINNEIDVLDITSVRQVEATFEAFREICQQMETKVKRNIQARMIQEMSPTQLDEARRQGLFTAEDGDLVGDMDLASGFGIGEMPAGARPGASAVIAQRRKRGKKAQAEKDRSSPQQPSPTQAAKIADGSVTPAAVTERDDDVTARDTAFPSAPAVPPSRVEAFEKFKEKEGSEIYRILCDNKEAFAKAKKSYADLAKQINNAKQEIDKSKEKLRFIADERERVGPMLNQNGDIIIEESEYLEIQRLQDLKKTYRVDFDELRKQRSEVQYCQRLVEQCRQRLIQEFDHWYAESFLNGGDPAKTTSLEAGIGSRLGTRLPGIYTQHQQLTTEDDGEKFDRLQRQILQEHPDSMAFYSAKMKLLRRRTYDAAMSQPQPAYRTTPGSPLKALRHPPPLYVTTNY